MEKWRILDDNGNYTGEIMDKIDKSIFDKGIYHLAADIWVINSENKILIQKRSNKKKLFPNVWATTGGSVILNENSKDTVIREIKEELNIDIKQDDLNLISRIKVDNIWLDSYFVRGDFDINKMTFQEGEVSDAKWVTCEEIEELIKKDEFIIHRWEYVGDFIKKETNNK